MTPLVSLVIPVRNEHENIGPCLERIERDLADLEHEVLVCYDSEKDTTLPAIAALAVKPARLRLVKNDLGPSPSYAMRAGLAAAAGDVVVVTMADLSDEPRLVRLMAEKIRGGADVVSGSRYMPGGRQIGGPRVKTFLSRAAGLSLRWIAGLGTHDATTSYRAFSRRLLTEIPLESTTGFTLGLEATVKAHLAGLTVDEVPALWTDRTAGESNFRVGAWLGAYLHWYALALAAPVTVLGAWLALSLVALGRPPRGESVLELTLGGLLGALLPRRRRGRTAFVDVLAPVAWLAPLLAGARSLPALVGPGLAMTAVLLLIPSRRTLRA
jgi:dolichol-phosphate mannosyltransferase